MARRPFIAGNWKMHKGAADADSLAVALKAGLVDQTAVDVAVAPPFVSLSTVARRLQHTGILIAGQDLHAQATGAYTSAVSGEMLKGVGCAYVIVGHSERRSLFGDTDDVVNAKVQAAFRAGLLPILCVGETLQQRGAGNAEAVVTTQLSAALAGLATDQVGAVTVAYEPIWAIGTGQTASPEQAQHMHATIRRWLAATFAKWVGDQVRIQYGGSVKPGNARSLLRQPDIDGALVGGASLTAEPFLAIVNASA